MELMRILIVDDQTLFRRSLASMLEDYEHIRIVGEASDGQEAVEKARALAPDLILMDIRMPRCSGLEATREILKEMPTTNILVLTISDKDRDLFAAIKGGARGYLLKTADTNELLAAIELVAHGHAVVSPTMAASFIAEFSKIANQEAQVAGAAGTTLTDRENEVLVLLAQGRTNQEIAEALVLSENTVKSHVRNILHKLQLHNRVQAAIYALREMLMAE